MLTRAHILDHTEGTIKGVTFSSVRAIKIRAGWIREDIIIFLSCCRLTCIIYFPQEFVIKKLLAGKRMINVGKAELKIALVITFTVFSGIVNLVAYTRGDLRTTESLRSIQEHLVCESMGESADCAPIVESELSQLIIAGLVVLSFIPVVVLLVTCDLRTSVASTRSLFSS